MKVDKLSSLPLPTEQEKRRLYSNNETREVKGAFGSW
jgi:hypothetical protein